MLKEQFWSQPDHCASAKWEAKIHADEICFYMHGLFAHSNFDQWWHSFQ